jgi:glutamate mutase epsilon subunit
MRFEDVQKFLDERQAGKMNGIPLVNYGIDGGRRIEEVDVPEHLGFGGLI